MKARYVLAAALMAAGATATNAQTFPEQNVTLVVGAAPGVSTDVSARFLAEPLSKALGKPVVVENKSGASGNIAAAHVARAKPDGYTLLMQYSGYHVGNPHLFKNMNWALKDFAPVGLVTLSPHVLAVHPSVKVSNLKELADLAKAKPGALRYGSAGTGSILHLAMELFAQVTDTKLLHVPYRGGAPAVTDLLAGHIEIVNTTPPPFMGPIASGDVKALAYTSDKRHPKLPQVPTSAESGLPGYEVAAWFGVMAPAGTPPAVVETLASEIQKIVDTAEFRERMETQGGFAVFKGPRDFQALIDKEYVYWGNVIKTGNVRIEE